MADDVLATYGDGSACLVLTTSDAGALAVINADLAASNLPKSKAFVPLLDELVQQMFQGNRADRTAACGEPTMPYLPAEAGTAAGLEIAGPEATDDEPIEDVSLGSLGDEGLGVAWHWPSPERPGVYQVRRDDQVVFAMAVNAPAEESKFEKPEDRLSPEVFEESLAGGRDVVYRGVSGDGDRRNDVWKWLAVACAVCLLGELVALLAFKK